jgi:hypothetical protein
VGRDEPHGDAPGGRNVTVGAPAGLYDAAVAAPATIPPVRPGTVAILSTGGGDPHAIPVSSWVAAGGRIVVALARRRESLARLRRDPRAAFTVLAEGVAITAHTTASVVAESMDAAAHVAAVLLEIHGVQDHAEPRFALEDGVRWRWVDADAEAGAEAVRAELAALAARAG